MTEQQSDNATWLVWAALVALVFAAYFPVLVHGEFIWDDDFYVTENLQLDDLSGLVRIWTEPSSIPQYYPVTHTTFWIEHQLWGESAPGYRLINTLLHLLNALLLYGIVRQLRIPGALLLAFVFALHPIEVESVAWITERKNVLSFFFMLLALRKLLVWQDCQDSRRHFNLAFLFFLLAMGSKTVVATLPAVFLVITWLRQRPVQPMAVKMIPFFLVSVVGSVATSLIEARSVGASGWEWDLTFAERLLLALRIPLFYVHKLLWPADLCFNYVRWNPQVSAVSLACAAGTLSLLGLAWAGRRRLGRGPLAAFLLFGGMLFPALGFINVYPMRYSFVADHFQYHAGAAFLALLCGIAARMAGGFPGRVRTAMGALPALGLAVLTFNYSHTFIDNESLFERALQVNPASWMAHDNLANLRRAQGQKELALEAAQAALRLNDKIPETWTSAAMSWEENGQPEKALRAFIQAAKRAPADPRTRLNLGLAMFKAGNLEAAEKELRAALVLQPSAATALSALGAVLLKAKRFDEAEKTLLEVVELDDAKGRDFMNLATLYQRLGRDQEKRKTLERAVKAEPGFRPAWRELCILAYERQDWEEADRTLRLCGSIADGDTKLSVIAVFLTGVRRGVAKNELDAASTAGQELLKALKFASFEAIEALAVVYAAKGQFSDAVVVAEQGARLAEQKQDLEWNSRFLSRAARFRLNEPLILYGK